MWSWGTLWTPPAFRQAHEHTVCRRNVSGSSAVNEDYTVPHYVLYDCYLITITAPRARNKRLAMPMDTLGAQPIKIWYTPVIL